MEKNDHDVLLENGVLLRELIRNFQNHLKHHWAVSILCLTAGVMGALNLFVGIILIMISMQV